MRAIIFGQSGLDKEAYLNEVLTVAEANGHHFRLLNHGQRMQQLDPEGRDPEFYPTLPSSEQYLLRRQALQSLVDDALTNPEEDYVLNVHAAFRTPTGVTLAADGDLLRVFEPDIVVVLLDDFHFIQRRLTNTAYQELRPCDILEWRAVEITTARAISEWIFSDKHDWKHRDTWRFYVLMRGHHPEVLYRLFYERNKRLRIYASFGITGTTSSQDERIRHFKQRLSENHIVFDPYKISERVITSYCSSLIEEIAEQLRGADTVDQSYSHFIETIAPLLPASSGIDLQERFVPQEVLPGLMTLSYHPRTEELVREDSYPPALLKSYSFPIDMLQNLSATIDGQIQSRDFLLIDQSEIVCAYIPWNSREQKPDISAGSQSELTYGKHRGRITFAICEGSRHRVSPWVTGFVDRFFCSLKDLEDELLTRYHRKEERGREEE